LKNSLKTKQHAYKVEESCAQTNQGMQTRRIEKITS
jgi:hypothetical protein